MVDVFKFEEGFPGRGRSTHVCVADEAAVRRVITRAEIDRVFFGYVLFKPLLGPGFVGVWGRRNASKFRRMLRERGLDLDVKVGPPPAPLNRWVTHGKARADATASPN